MTAAARSRNAARKPATSAGFLDAVTEQRLKRLNTILGDMSERPGAANGLLKALRVLLQHAVDMGLPHCSAHGLRKACATRLANAGCTPEQIKSITGYKTLSEVARYTKAADQERNAKQAMTNLLRSESEQACPTSGGSWTKTGNNPVKTTQFLEDGAPERIRTSDP